MAREVLSTGTRLLWELHEEEITTEPQEKVAYTANKGGFTDEVADILKELFYQGGRSTIVEHSYRGCDMSNIQDTEQEPEETRNADETSEQLLFRIPRKPYKFTPGQLWEMQAVFEETQYPDAFRRKELAELMNVDEQKVKGLFNNKRAKLKHLRGKY
ncbi:homeobox protein orthopedia B-like [Rattus rattus]|uniref:homeobox protein orthopedia B-like n=1 Tax=Rattus rattus TaxID=10117 RepID=UPI0013F31059|nr:homeobox protein orthopedia B-like [Rattus rattus]